LTLTRNDGDAIAVLLDEIREQMAIGSESLKYHRYVQAVEAAHKSELRRAEAARLLEQGGTTLQRQSLNLLEIELKLLNQRIRLAIGV
jgi:hypothetical protein